MTISLKIHGDVAVFNYPSGYSEIVEELDDLLERRDAGKVSRAGYVGALEDLVAGIPWFIDGHAHLGNALYEQGKVKLALESYERGYSLGTELLPSRFGEFIEWKFLENRPFLRAAHGAALCRLQLGHLEDAIAILEKVLVWNPDDNQGIRYLIGSEYLRAGEDEKAESYFVTEATEYPPYRYDLGLLLLRQGRHVEAATSLRHGFVENGYIAEILCGNSNPMPCAIWHGSSLAEPGMAKEYASHCAALWHLTPDAIPFLRWLHTHPMVMAERAAILECSEALLWEHDFEKRGSILRTQNDAQKRIGDALSKEIVVERKDRHGRLVSPWLYSRT